MNQNAPSQPPGPPAAPPPAAPPPAAPAPSYGAAAAPQPFVVPAQPKSRTVAAALAIILGSLGIHKFYMGKVGQGILYLVFFWTYIPGLVGWIEGILYLLKSDEAWAAEHQWPVQRANGVAIAILWVIALLPLLSIVAIIALIFLGSQVSSVLDAVGTSI
jgi:TM2 domain-containing membrane protein YozV